MEYRTQEERVQALKERFRKLGIASYTQSGMDEEQSLLAYIREGESFRYAFVREPYVRSKNPNFRLLKVNIWNPQLPMGYYSCPGFCFDYMGEDPLKEAAKLAVMVMGRKYKAVLKRDTFQRASFKKINEESHPLTDEDKEHLKSRNFVNIRW